MKFNRTTLESIVRQRRLTHWHLLATFAALLVVAAGLAYAFAQYGRSVGPDSRPAAIDQLPKVLSEPNAYKPLTAEQAIEANAAIPFVSTHDRPAGKFVIKADTNDRLRAVECLAQAIYYESANEGSDGQRAVAQVVLNRMRHPGYPASVCGVVYQGSERETGCQFTFTCDGSLLRPPNARMFAAATKIAIEALGGHVFAPVGHATNYHADYVVPYWASTLDKQIQIGRHIFYRLRGNLGSAAAFRQNYRGTEPTILPQRTIILSNDAADLARDLLDDSVTGVEVDNRRDVTPVAADSISTIRLAADEQASELKIDGEASSLVKKPAQAKEKACPMRASDKMLPTAPVDLKSGDKSQC